MVQFLNLVAIILIFGAAIINCKPLDDDDRIVFQNEDTQEEGILESDHSASDIESRLKIKPESENGRHFQGDIVLLPEQKEILLSGDTEDTEDEGFFSTRTGILSESYRWPKNREGKVIVPYKISEPRYTSDHKTIISFAMKDIEKYTCVQFKNRTTERDYINIYSGSGCHSNLGRIGGKQNISLASNGCFKKGTVIHEIIHALGYDHMHSDADRDDYVTIVWENINEAQYDNFDKVDRKKFGNFNTTYDLYSVMHYTSKAFSKNGKHTIIPKDKKYLSAIGQRLGMSINDAKRINNMYKCKL